MKYSLNGNWIFKNLTDNGEFFPALVPSTNYNDLLKNNLIPDPFVKMNEKETVWVGDKDWLYSKTFDISEEVIKSSRVELVADCLDAISEVYLNDAIVAKTFNAHIGYRFDIKPYLVLGNNKLDIIFRSPVKYALSEKDRVGKNTMVKDLDKRIFIRKAQCHFDWDWGPEIPYSGITKDIYIEYDRDTRINDLKIEQEHGNNFVNLNVKATLTGGDAKEKELTYYKIKVTEPSGNVITKVGVIAPEINRTILIENPVLWWTHELNPVSEQALYSVEVYIGEEDDAIDYKKLNIGLRTIELDRSKDKFGSNFRFILNGVPIFAKGANWIPADSFIDRVGKKEYSYYVDAAVNANMNMIRVWGGGFYEDDCFYEECDKKGILIWQDCCFACRPYPFFDERFMSSVKEEIEYNVKRLRLHPCLALWCGNNEIEQMSNTWFWHTAFVKANKKFFWEELESEIRKYDTQTSYIPGSPVGVDFNKAVSSDNHGDNHLWIVWHGLQDVKYYRKRKTRFCSEFGFESLPDIKTIERYADKEDYSITSKVFLQHQKCMLGNQKMEYYITSRFRLPKKFEDYVYLSQACQMECIKDATEFWRRNRDRSNGSLYWQLNDCWPVCSWSSIDYYGNYKALQYHARHFFAPVAVTIDGDKKGVRVNLLNDTLKDVNAILKLKVVDFDKGVIDEIVSEHLMERTSVSTVYDIPLKEIKAKYNIINTAFVCELSVNDEIVNTKTLLFKYEKYLKLNEPNLKLETKVENGVIYVKIKAEKFARLVRLSDKVSTLPFSDNWFDLIPGEEKIVTLPYYEGFTSENIEAVSSYDIEAKGSKLYDAFIKAKFILNPVNLAIYIGQPRSNFDYNDK